MHRVAFVVPRGVTWALPPYELALQLAAHANESTITPDETVATETAGLDILGEAFDLAGNKGTDKATVKLDKTEPSIKGEVIAGKLGDDGWYTGPVTVHFTCSDALSGVDVCPEDEVINSNGLAQKATGKAIDAAGNSASTTVSVNIDQVARPRRSSASTRRSTRWAPSRARPARRPGHSGVAWCRLDDGRQRQRRERAHGHRDRHGQGRQHRQ